MEQRYIIKLTHLVRIEKLPNGNIRRSSGPNITPNTKITAYYAGKHGAFCAMPFNDDCLEFTTRFKNKKTATACLNRNFRDYVTSTASIITEEQFLNELQYAKEHYRGIEGETYD